MTGTCGASPSSPDMYYYGTAMKEQQAARPANAWRGVAVAVAAALVTLFSLGYIAVMRDLAIFAFAPADVVTATRTISVAPRPAASRLPQYPNEPLMASHPQYSSALQSTSLDEPATAPPSNLLPAQRYVATNQFQVRPGSDAKFEARWANRKSRLAQLDGFRFFTLLRRVDLGGTVQYDDDINYVSLTVWEGKDAFTAWRKGEAFKEAHGGNDFFSFVKMVTSSLLTIKGAPKPAFYEGLIPVANTPEPTKTVNGWRAVEANGEDLLEGECFVAMNRFKVREGQYEAFEARWSKRDSKLLDQPGFRGFWLGRNDPKTMEGVNYVAMTVWDSEENFIAWRDVNDKKSKEGPVSSGRSEMFVEFPKPAFYVGKLRIESELGI
eukprot:CAMPEP_0174289646 /NCGR_PEP_ID=MMETSP0809-20121228/25791_1 /TAXON_ID=73025 ORGANISM="Eutreptiella gymnastica-like, Strain CCMP1594" /NCGR_SAMPLE_ID=MMETSP0809 /ASSEMBLY_ACC=CAM_ASM_000658 /LENGTH=380 /DNA_ID=CAMNT_0015387717 /DNA_START=19 /DNA_END=1161 /DNA_ORIENTATION=+